MSLPAEDCNIAFVPYAGVQYGRLLHEDCMLFLRIATKQPPLPLPRFAAMLSDLASIAHSENTPDILLAYEL